MAMKKRISFSLFMICLIIFSLLSCVQPVYADDEPEIYYCRICKKAGLDYEHDVSELSFSQKVALEWNDILYSGDWFGENEPPAKNNSTAGTDNPSGETNTTPSLTTEDVLKFDTQSNFATLWSTAEMIYNLVKPIGIILCVVYALMELLEEVTTDNVSPEKIVRTLTKICIGVLFVQNGFKFCTFVVETASAVFNILSAGTAGMDANNCLLKTLKNNSFTQGMTLMSGLFIPWLISLLTQFIVSIICWVRIMDIMVKIILAPIGMSDIMVTGTRGTGWAFFKKLLVSALQGAVILGITFCYGQILTLVNSGAVTTGLPAYGLAIIGAVVTLAAIIKSQSYAQDIVN